jgi:two-component system sensor kinase FixL
MLIVQKDGSILQVNSRTEQLFGYPREELLGKPAEILVPERFRGKHPMQRSGYFIRPGSATEAKPNGQELYGLRKDASEFPVEISLTPLESDTGTMICSSIRDISERKQAEAAIHRQSRILKSILDSIGDAVLVADENGQFLLFNPAAENLFRLGASPNITETWTKRYGLFAPDMITPYPTRELPLVRAIRGESVDGAEIYVRHEGISEGIWTSANARPLKDDEGTVRGGVVVFRNITERKEAEEQLTAFAGQLKRSNRELQEFASVASHDLQEPLRKIQAFGDRLQARSGAALDSQARDYLERMLTAASRMRSLIDDLLTFSRVTTKAQPFLPVNLNVITREVLSDLENRLHQTGGKVEVADLPTVEADPLQMRQLLQNLISNGLKFHRTEQVPLLKIQARILPPGTKVNNAAGNVRLCQITVQDNGIGFDERYLDRLFHVFQRLHGRSEYEGTGMGLAICRRIAERHGGTITAKSTPGKGATFFVTLPLTHSLGGKAS